MQVTSVWANPTHRIGDGDVGPELYLILMTGPGKGGTAALASRLHSHTLTHTLLASHLHHSCTCTHRQSPQCKSVFLSLFNLVLLFLAMQIFFEFLLFNSALTALTPKYAKSLILLLA